MNQRTRQRGFTLVEIAIGMVVIGIALGMGITLLSAQIQRQQLDISSTHFDTITQALIDYVGRTSKLPCPAVATLAPTSPNYGVADSSANCSATITVPSGSPTTAIGVVPWITLGVSLDNATDGYNNLLTYMVTITETTRDANSITYMKGTITVHSAAPVVTGLPKTATTQNQVNACSQTPGDDGCRLAGVVALMSHGKNGMGAYLPSGQRQLAPNPATQAEEYQNYKTASGDVRLVQQGLALSSVFDDFVKVLSPNDILGPLSKANIIKTPRAVTLERLQLIKSALLSYFVQQGIPKKLPYADNAAAPNGTSDVGMGNGTMAGGATYALQDVPAHGNIPNVTLGLPSFGVFDGWGNRFWYQLDNTLATAGLTVTLPTGSNIGFRIESVGPDGTAVNTDDVYIDVTVNEIRGLLTLNSIPF